MAIRRFFAERALLPEGWAHRVLIEIGEDGVIIGVSPDGVAGDSECASGPVLPAMPNLHSHAFQRAMAGRGSSSGGTGSWDRKTGSVR